MLELAWKKSEKLRVHVYIRDSLLNRDLVTCTSDGLRARRAVWRESTLQELLNEISSAGKLGIKLLMSLFE